MCETQIIQWHTSALSIDFVVNKDGVICLGQVLPPGTSPKRSASKLFESSELPLVSVKLSGEGQTKDIKTAKALVGNCLSMRLKYDSHHIHKDGQAEVFEARCSDEATKIKVLARLTVYGCIPVVRSETTVTNVSENANVLVTGLSSFVVGGMTSASERWFEEYKLMYATNSWFREVQWQEYSLPELGIDNNGICELHEGHTGSQATFGLSARGSYSTNSHLPMGILRSNDHTDTWLWQVESNGSWQWEIGDYNDSIYLAAGGPTGAHLGWKKLLRPGESFTSVPAACCRVTGDIEAAFAALTDYRRQIRRPHEDMERVPIVFNDYMNCLMGDPDEQKIEALLDPVADLGAKYFVIDAGWYSDDSDWWYDVGLWEPSKKRFPSGFKTLLDKIREKGLIPGLWLEPEVVGVRSVVGDRLPKEAFFQEDGHRIVEKGRFQLDYRHPHVIAWMNSVIHTLVVEYGAGFFKFDYNIQVMQGTDVDGPSTAGAAHLEHQRAYLAWVKSQLDKYPGLVIETCSSGAQRLDYAMLAVHSIQSTSDQQDPALYAAISAAMPTAVTPEQSGSWAYPQAKWSDEINALTVINSLLGRVYLSGRVDQMSPEQLSLVKEGMTLYKAICNDIKTAHATWPLGLPKWNSDWVSLGLVSKDKKTVYVAIWRRGGPTRMDIQIKATKGWPESRLELLYPAQFPTDVVWDSVPGVLHIEVPETVCARLFRIQ